MAKLAPSILNADFKILGEQLKILKQGSVDTLHIDVMDGNFVDNISFAFPILESLKDSDFSLDIHLMISDPMKYVERFCEYGDIVTIHLEASPQPAEILRSIRQKCTKAGIAINPDTPIDALLPLMGEFDLALIMSVFPGYGGQSFMPETLEKAQLLQEYKIKHGFMMEIDGGITINNLESVLNGAEFDYIVMGSAVMKNNIKENLDQIRRIL